MEWLWGGLALFAVGPVILFFLYRPMTRLGREIQFERSRELFALQRERLQDQFWKAAAASGKPRGLRWQACQWDTAVAFAREKSSGQIAALLPITIHFEAIEGGDMEGNPAVGLPRNASAVFFFHRGQWHTVGKAIFNKNPDEALRHFHHQYEALPSS